MKLDGRRTSSNVDDRRRGATTAASLGIGGIIIAAIVTWIMGGNPLDVVTSQMANVTQTGTAYTPSAEEDALAEFSSKI